MKKEKMLAGLRTVLGGIFFVFLFLYVHEIMNGYVKSRYGIICGDNFIPGGAAFLAGASCGLSGIVHWAYFGIPLLVVFAAVALLIPIKPRMLLAAVLISALLMPVLGRTYQEHCLPYVPLLIIGPFCGYLLRKFLIGLKMDKGR